MPSYVSPVGVRHVLLVVAAVVLVGTALRAGQAPAVPRAAAPQPAATTAQAAAPAAVELFETKVRPLLAANCYACHSQSAMAGLRVDSREALLKGGETGPALVPGDPEKSPLLKVMQHAEGFPRMPRGRAKLPAADIEAVAEWIKAGAVWPGSAETTTAAPAAPEKVDHGRSSARSGRSSRWPATRRPPVHQCGVAAHRHRSVHPRAAGEGGPVAGRRRRQAHAAAPRHAGPDGAAAHAGGSRRVPEGRVAGRVREGGRSAARLAALRRSVGPRCGWTWRATARTTTAASIRRAAASTRIPTRTSIATG